MSREMLLKHGWSVHSRKRSGCVLNVWWVDPVKRDDGRYDVVTQGHAVSIQRMRNKAKPAQEPPDAATRAASEWRVVPADERFHEVFDRGEVWVLTYLFQNF